MKYLSDYDLHSLEVQFAEWGQNPGHARRVLRRFYECAGWPNLDELPIAAPLRNKLKEMPQRQSRVLARTTSADGTVKLLIGFDGGGAVEAVLMLSHRPDRAAVCLSSQIGCAMGCDFCASTKSGLERNLTPGEIAEQFLHLREQAQQMNRRLTSLVFMGMGEPMHNLDNVIGSIQRIANPLTAGIGWRQVTVSTVGIVPGIDRLAEADLNIHLAVSLHAPDDTTRSQLIPMNRRYKAADIIAAAKRFEHQTGRIPTIEYTLLAGVNDSVEQAGMLADLLEGFRCHVNLIHYNPIGSGLSGRVYERCSQEQFDRFFTALRVRGVIAHPRQTRGDDVNAACGQLRERQLHGTGASPVQQT